MLTWFIDSCCTVTSWVWHPLAAVVCWGLVWSDFSLSTVWTVFLSQCFSSAQGLAWQHLCAHVGCAQLFGPMAQFANQWKGCVMSCSTIAHSLALPRGKRELPFPLCTYQDIVTEVALQALHWVHWVSWACLSTCIVYKYFCAPWREHCIWYRLDWRISFPICSDLLNAAVAVIGLWSERRLLPSWE